MKWISGGKHGQLSFDASVYTQTKISSKYGIFKFIVIIKCGVKGNAICWENAIDNSYHIFAFSTSRPD